MKANLVIAEDSKSVLHFVHEVDGDLVAVPCSKDADSALAVFDRVMNGEGGFHRAALYRRPSPHRERNCAEVGASDTAESALEPKGKKLGKMRK